MFKIDQEILAIHINFVSNIQFNYPLVNIYKIN